MRKVAASPAASPGRGVDGSLDAVTFDFWNTLMWEEQGSLRARRVEFWKDALADVGAPIEVAALERAHDAAHTGYVCAWEENRQFRVESAATLMMEMFGRIIPSSAREVLVEGFSEAGRQAAIHPSQGVRDCLLTLLHAGVRLGIVCDIGLTPSLVVRELLDRHSLLELFDDTTFSDEVGHYKPARPIFEHALQRLGDVNPERAAHVGDRRRTDVAGARAMGMTAVRYNGAYEDDAVSAPEADIVLAELAKLPPLLGVAEMRG
ncbi:MAG: HAD family hydrolase [Actinobacteria bacterium]|nr:HAD family hydrolase [Actinomycetota bacterium]